MCVLCVCVCVFCVCVCVCVLSVFPDAAHLFLCVCLFCCVGGYSSYSGYGKYSDPLKFFTLCYIAAICENHLSSFFFLINVHTAPHIDRKTQNCWHFCRFIKKEKLKYHMVLSIQTLCCDTHIFNSGAVHFFWSSLRWFYTFIWVQLCWLYWWTWLGKPHTCLYKTLQLTVHVRANENHEVKGTAWRAQRQNCGKAQIWPRLQKKFCCT